MNPDEAIDAAAVEPVRGDADRPAENATAVNDGFVPQMDPSDSAELNAIKDRLLKVGRTTVAAAWESGRLSLAKQKLKGHYTQWVRMECAIDPRTAFSYVRLNRQFQADRIRLVASNISISVAMYLGGAPYAVKDRILQAASVNGIRVTHAYIDAEIWKQMAFEWARDGEPEEKAVPTPKEREISFRAALKRHVKGAAIVAFRQAMEEAADALSAAVTYDERLTPADISKRAPEVIGKMLAKEIPGDPPDQTLTLAERLSRAVAARVEEVWRASKPNRTRFLPHRVSNRRRSPPRLIASQPSLKSAPAAAASPAASSLLASSTWLWSSATTMPARPFATTCSTRTTKKVGRRSLKPTWRTSLGRTSRERSTSSPEGRPASRSRPLAPSAAMRTGGTSSTTS